MKIDSRKGVEKSVLDESIISPNLFSEPQPPSKMNGNATDLSGTIFPEVKANVVGGLVGLHTSRSGAKPDLIARSPRSATFPFTFRKSP
jgi:hypothetical protein